MNDKLKKYESNNHLLNELADKLISANSLLKKAKEEPGSSSVFGNYVREVMSLNQDANVIASELYKSFIILQEDHGLGVISTTKYRDHLFDYKSFFEISDLQPLQIPVSMGHLYILQEIRKHFS
jgi:hypothetical protein